MIGSELVCALVSVVSLLWVEATYLRVWEFIAHRPLDLCASDEDPVQLTIRPEWDAPHVSSFLRRFEYRAPPDRGRWVRLSALHRIEYRLELHTRISGPDRLSTKIAAAPLPSS